MSTKEIRCIYCKGVHTSPIEKDSYICEYCGGLNYITTTEEDFNFQLANNNLSIYKFEEADDIYKKIIDESTNDKTTSMALMGRLLSYFGIVYVRGYGSKVTTPTFARYNPDIPSIKSSRYYKQLCNLDIDSYELQKYKTQIDELDKVYTRIDNDLNDTPEYDVFICTKISMRTKDEPNNKGYTEDSSIATKLYFILSKEGLNVFYSDITLKGVEYDSQIYSALSKSKTILVISSSKEYLESVWVESEWRRWLNFIDVGFRKKDTFLLHLIEKGIEVPSVLQKAQVIDYYKIYDAIDSIVNKDKKKANQNNVLFDELKKIQEETEKRQREIEEANKKRIQELEEGNKRRQKELEEEIRKNNNNPVNTQTGHIHSWVTKIYEPTCTHEGYTEYKCPECGFVIKEDIISKKPHKYKIRKVEATCKSGSYDEYKCIECGYIEKRNISITPTNNHILFGNKCKVCGKKMYSIGLNVQDNNDHWKCFIEGLVFGVNISKGKCVDKDLVIPSDYNGKKINFIGQFNNMNTLETVEIMEGPVSIFSYAFDRCCNLKDVYLPKSIKKCGAGAFDGCINLENVYYSGTIDDWFNITFESLGSNPMYYAKHLFVKNTDGTLYEVINIEIPKNINTINPYTCLGLNVNKINIPKNICSIKEYAFCKCQNLKEVIFENNSLLTSIGRGVFSGCKSIETMIIPESVVEIGESVFKDCLNLKKIVLPNKLTSIETCLFENCSKLVEFTLPNSVMKIGYSVFKGCSSLTNIVIPSNVKSIGWSSFLKCDNLEQVTIPGDIKIEGDKDPFINCLKLNRIVFHDKTKEITKSSYVMQNITDFVLPDNIEKIDNTVFDKCINLKKIIIKDTFNSSIENLNILHVFKNINQIENYSSKYKVLDDVLYSIDGKKLICCFNKTIKNFIVPNQVNEICSFAFYNCNSLESICLSDNVEVIKENAFSSCNNLNNVSLNEGLMKIEECAFSNCTKLKSIYIPNTVKEIGKGAVLNCNKLEMIYLPFIGEKLNSIDNSFFGYVFGADTALQNNRFIPTTLKTVILIDLFNFDVRVEISDNAFYDCVNLEIIKISNSICSIGNNAFKNCKGLSKIIIPNTVNKIGKGILENCDHLNTLSIPFVGESKGIGKYKHFGYIFGSDTYKENNKYVPNSLENVIISDENIIEMEAFSNCVHIKTIEFMAGMEIIERLAFNCCEGLETIILPNTIKRLDFDRLSYNKVIKLTNLKFNGTLKEWNSIEYNVNEYAIFNVDNFYLLNDKNEFYKLTDLLIQPDVIEIGRYAGFNCIETVKILSSATRIKNSTFYQCYGLKYVELPDSIVDIGYNAFFDCPKLENINFPKKLQKIGNNAFYNTVLKEIVLHDEVTIIGDGCFYGCCYVNNIRLSNKLESIGTTAFMNMNALSEIVIPKSVNEIKDSAFAFLSNLTIYCEAKKPLFGYPKGYAKTSFDEVKKVIWNYKK